MVGKNTLPKTTLSLVGAGLLGAGMGLLFAPQSGARTRRDIRRLTDNLANHSKRFYEDLGDHWEDVVDWYKDGHLWIA